MSESNAFNIINTLLAGLLSGVVVAVLNYVFTRRKLIAEAKKAEVETEKISLEIDKLRLELRQNTEDISATINYQLPSISESIIYDSQNRDIGFDFEGKEAIIWKKIDGKDTPTTERAKGSIDFLEGGILNIQRINEDGRYSVWLLSYLYDGDEKPLIPADDLSVGQRKLRISFEAKVVGAEHTLKFVLKNLKTNRWIAHEDKRITENTWLPFKIYFQISPNEEVRLRIDDQDVSKAPSSIQIRNIVLAERTS
jgi:hypothetical protein